VSAAPRADWAVIEPHYRAGLRSLPDIAAEFGISHTAIAKHARKNGWERDIKARIQAKADAKVSAAMVAAEVSPETKATEALRVEVEAEVQARIRLDHRRDIGKFRLMAMNMAAELEELADERLPIRTKALKDLTDVTKTLVAMEREAFGLESAPPPAPQTFDFNDPAALQETARRLAFTFATAQHQASRTLQ
jgi:hypothetical protein